MLSFLRRWFGRRPASQEETQPDASQDSATEAWQDIRRALAPPTDLRSPAAWDEFWDRQLALGVVGLSDMLFDDRDLVELMRRSDLKTILIAGNGLSLEPRALAAAGFDVVALDISPKAVQYAQQITFTESHLESMLGRDAVQPGGRLQFVVGDVFEPSVCTGPFDVVIERLTAQNYPDDTLGGFLTMLINRLSPAGVLVTHCHDNSWRPGAESRHRPGDWLRVHEWATFRRVPSGKPPGRLALLVSSTG